MKKQFFYAALAIALMSSCSKDNDPGITPEPENPTPDVIDDTTPVAIELGIGSPNITVSTRGTGTVGSSVVAENKWSGQTLGILMYKIAADGTETPAEEVIDAAAGTTAPIFQDLTFKAPNDATTGLVQMLSNVTAGTHKAKYYPSSGRFSFYGYHVDDATHADIDETTKTISNIVIDGSQDLLAAVTAPVPTTAPAEGSPYYNTVATSEDWAKMSTQSFSAWSARRKVQPYLNFEHKLARLRFFVKAGEKAAAAKEWKNDTWTEKAKVQVNGTDESTAVTITQIKVKSLANSLDMILARAAEGASQQTVPLQVNAASTPTDFLLKDSSKDADGKLQTLQPIAPEYDATETVEAAKAAETGYKESTLVGESLMFFPTGESETVIGLEIALRQAVIDEYTVGNDGTENPSKYVLKSDNLPYTLEASSIQKGGTAISKFEPGKSYDITIKVYGYQRIEITAALSAWVDGGSVEVSPGDEFKE